MIGASKQEKNHGAQKRAQVTQETLKNLGLQYEPVAAEDIEEKVLGALLLERDCIEIASSMLVEDDFYKTEHLHVFNAITALHRENGKIDISTVVVRLRKMGNLEAVGGAYFVSELTNRVGSAANLEYHCRLLMQCRIKRRMAPLGYSIFLRAHDIQSDCFDDLDEAEAEFNAIRDIPTGTDEADMRSIGQELIDHIERAKSAPAGVPGIPTGLLALDNFSGGFQKGDLVIIAARPGMGKTALALFAAKVAAKKFKKPGAVFSLEMSSVQLMMRLVADECKISTEKIRLGNLTADEFEALKRTVHTELAGVPLYIDDTPSITLFQLGYKARKLKRLYGIEFIMVDYLQLMRGNGDTKGNREQEISQISRGLKALAKDIDIPVIALSQLSRQVEQRGGSKKPMLSDLRESGSIEQDADVVIFPYCPHYYGLTEDENGQPYPAGFMEVTYAKNRHGKAGVSTAVGFKAMTMTFYDYDWTHNENQAMIAATSNVSQQAEERSLDVFGTPGPGIDFRKVRGKLDNEVPPPNEEDDPPF